ncbi:myb-like protein X isoform X2 [Hylaeus volcanicus]|uniref:myb-like protein X isoform X2 n=1 Tax=Hylaeus volcanicus TaxID=313075 RepID=UPI0023B7E444|nr:myb-like protein X isoform X2 [Hylaeus volcanicus]
MCRRIKKMEDDTDIYGDLPSFELKYGEKLASKNEENVTPDRITLEKQVKELTVQLENSRKINKNLEVNMVSLLKTAKAEIARKDKMIDELRKKRAKYAKTNEYRKSNFREAVVNIYCKPSDFPVSVNEIKEESFEPDTMHNPTKDPNLSKSTLTPITLFGERLRKRIADEQYLERMEKQSSKFTVNGNSAVHNEGYVAESDKENGSLHDTNSCNTKEVQSLVGSQYSESEPTKNLLIISKVITREKNEPEKVNHTGKRANDDTSTPVTLKRIKFENEEYLTETVKTEGNDRIAVEPDKKHDSLKLTKIEHFDNFTEVRLTAKSSDIESSRKLNTEVKKYGYRNGGTVKREERKYIKDENDISCDKKVAKEHSLKRHHKLGLEEWSAGHRSNAIAWKDDYRTNNVEHHRAKHKEDRRVTGTDDHRSRARSTSYKSCREEKYIKHKHNKHGYGERFEKHGYGENHGDKVEKHYNFRSTSVDKTKFFNRETRSPRNTTGRSSMDRKMGNSQISSRYDDYGSRKLKNDDRKKQDENSGWPHRKSGVVKSTTRSKHCEVSKREKNREKSREKCGEKSNEKDGEKSNEKDGEKSNEKDGEKSVEERQNQPPPRPHQVNLSSQNYVDLIQDSNEFQDGEISPTALNINLNEDNECNESGNRGNDNDEQTVSPLANIGEEELKDDEGVQVQNEFVEKSDASTNDVSSCPPIVTASSPNKQCSENNESIENENLENIEKFIRDYASDSETHEKTQSSSGVVLAEHAERENGEIITKYAKEYPLTNGEQKNSEKIHLPESNVEQSLTLHAEQETNAKLLTAESRDTSLDKDRIEMQLGLATPVKKAEGIECELINSTELSHHDCLFVNTVEKVSSGCLKLKGLSKNITVDLELPDNECNVNDNGDKEVCRDSETGNDNLDNCNDDNVIRNGPENDSKGESTVKNADVHELNISLGKSNITNAKIAPANIHGKVVLFARRKKPVCLANNNANMTIVINNTSDSSTNSLDASDSSLKLRTCRRFQQDNSDVVGT